MNVGLEFLRNYAKNRRVKSNNVESEKEPMDDPLKVYKNYAKMTQVRNALLELKESEVIAVLREVFSKRIPLLEDLSWYKNKYFLGIAGNELISDPDAGEIENWSGWKLTAIGYMNPKYYDAGAEPDEGFRQFGTCANCGFEISATVKRAICPICDSEVSLT
jgi:hypothetical protein